MQSLTKVDKVVIEDYHYMTNHKQKGDLDETSTSIVNLILKISQPPFSHLHLLQNH